MFPRVALAGQAVISRAPLAAQVPWLAAVLIAPFWFGGVGAACQVALALVIAFALLLNFSRVRCVPQSAPGRASLAGIIAVIVIMLLPFPRTLGPAPEFEALTKESFAVSFAPGQTVLRVWQLGMAVAVFALCRGAIRIPHFAKALTIALAAAIVVQAGLELWRLADGRGIWIEPRHHPAGTFANRNHFASWMVAGAIFLFGALLRKTRRMREGRSGRADKIEWAFYGVAILLAITVVIGCGSRGGLLALGTGLVIWAWNLWTARSRGWVVAAFSILLMCVAAVFLFAGDAAMSRVNAGGDLGFKWQIWYQSLGLVARFPWVGIGVGSFEDVFSALKTFHGEGTVLFAENEYLQWAVETGLAGTLFALLAIIPAARLFRAGIRRAPRKELFYGALAALAALFAQAFFEFVFHVQSVLLLAGVLLGVAVGLAEQARGAAEPAAGRADFAGTSFLLALAGGLALHQGRAMHEWWSATDARGQAQAAALWPLDGAAAIQTARGIVAQDAGMTPARTHAAARLALTRAVAWRPYNWELRLERAWLDMAFATPGEDFRAEAHKAILLNPLQPKVPLRFASALAARQPARALEWVRLAPISRYEDIREALRIGWLVSGDASLLWEITPASAEGLRALAQFARENNLIALAEQAERLREHGGNGGNNH